MPFDNMLTTITHITKILIPTVLLFGFAMYGFSAPTEDPIIDDIPVPINASGVAQEKLGSLWIDNVIAGTLDAVSTLCIGSDCRNTWASGEGDFSTTCRINTMLVTSTQSSTDGHGVPHQSNAYNDFWKLARGCLGDGITTQGAISPEHIEDGWMFVSFDNCPGVASSDCAGASYCQYIQLECDAGVERTRGRKF